MDNPTNSIMSNLYFNGILLNLFFIWDIIFLPHPFAFLHYSIIKITQMQKAIPSHFFIKLRRGILTIHLLTILRHCFLHNGLPKAIFLGTYKAILNRKDLSVPITDLSYSHRCQTATYDHCPLFRHYNYLKVLEEYFLTLQIPPDSVYSVF